VSNGLEVLTGRMAGRCGRGCELARPAILAPGLAAGARGNVSDLQTQFTNYPIPEECPRQFDPANPLLLSINLGQQYGFAVTVLAGRNAYIAVESDHGMWESEPQDYVMVSFRLAKDADTRWAVANMLRAVCHLVGKLQRRRHDHRMTSGISMHGSAAGGLASTAISSTFTTRM
jgi:hypothetical protein